MKLKKILSAVVATAMAVTTMTSMASFSVNAAETKTVWEDEVVLDSTWANFAAVTVANLPKLYENDVVTVEFTVNAANPQLQIQTGAWGSVVLDGCYDWGGMDLAADATSASFTLTADQATAFNDGVSEGLMMRVKGQNITITAVTVTSGNVPESPSGAAVEIWSGEAGFASDWGGTNADYPYGILVSTSKISDFYEGDVITVGLTADAAGSQIQIQTGAWGSVVLDGCYDWGGMDVAANATSVSFKLTAEQAAAFNEDAAGGTIMIVKGANITITSISVTPAIRPNVTYKQETAVANGVKSVRFVQLISEERAESVSSVSFTLTNGTASTSVTTNKCYDAVSAAGATITAPEGYVFVAVAVKNVPADVDLGVAAVEFTDI